MAKKFTFGEIVYLPIESLELLENPFDEMSEKEFEELKKSIQKHGLIYEVIVVEHPEKPSKYVVIDGRNRTRAMIELGEKRIPCRILKIPKYEGDIISYEVELYRRHLTPESKISKQKEKENLENTIKKQLKAAILKLLPNVSEDLKQALSDKDLSINSLIEIYETLHNLKEKNPLGQMLLYGILKSDKTPQAKDMEEHLKNLKKEIESLKEELQEKEEQLQILTQDLEEKESRIVELLNEREQLLEKAKKDFLKELEKRKAELKEEVLKEIEEGQINEKMLEEYRLQLQAEYGEKLSEYQNKINELTALLRKQQEEKSKIESQVRLLKDRLKQFEVGTKQLKELLNRSKALNQQIISTITFYAKLDCIRGDIHSLITLCKIALDRVDAFMTKEEFQNLLNRWKEVKKEIEMFEGILEEAGKKINGNNNEELKGNN